MSPASRRERKPMSLRARLAVLAAVAVAIAVVLVSAVAYRASRDQQVNALDDALEVFSNHVGAANHLGLLAEEVDPSSAAPLGNYPQGFSHIGLIQAAARLDLALRMRDEGIERPPLLDSDFQTPR